MVSNEGLNSTSDMLSMKRSQTLQKTLNMNTYSKETFAATKTNEADPSVNEIEGPLYTGGSSTEENSVTKVSVSVSNPALRSKLFEKSKGNGQRFVPQNLML